VGDCALASRFPDSSGSGAGPGINPLRLAGFQILDAVKRLDDREIFKQIILEDISG
jgi:hypothetical protein